MNDELYIIRELDRQTTLPNCGRKQFSPFSQEMNSKEWLDNREIHKHIISVITNH